MKAPSTLRRAHRMELRAELALAGVRKHPGVKFGSALAQIADQPPLMAVSGSVLVFALLRGDKRLAEASARVLTAVGVTTALKSRVEGAVRRTRPNAVLDGKPYRMRRGGAKAGAESPFRPATPRTRSPRLARSPAYTRSNQLCSGRPRR